MASIAGRGRFRGRLPRPAAQLLGHRVRCGSALILPLSAELFASGLPGLARSHDLATLVGPIGPQRPVAPGSGRCR